jgi:hypothetical protein
VHNKPPYVGERLRKLNVAHTYLALALPPAIARDTMAKKGPIVNLELELIPD